ncbi:hypothetical protein [uncultured Tateyamaria sp.]|uniref:hypothetical protein n=1 Tax=Tateyamaria sp. 1078 TaxID=3417464 RepID=UPI0026123360|nr:hypothetical protein [uncultured Tateyamaria sp.]
MSNTINAPLNMHIELKADELKAKRIAWEEGAYKRSNEELYELLEDCLTFFNDLRGNVSKCKALNAYLKDKGIQFNESASLATRVVRAVFDSNFQKRAYGYARVITIAADEKPANVSMGDFITKRGGIEELRRTKQNGKTPTEQREENIAFAKQQFETADALVPAYNNNASAIEFSDGAEHKLFVAIVRREADGSYSIVHETNAVGVVNAALAQAGKENSAEASNKAANEKRAQDEADGEADLAAAVDAAQKLAA